MKIKTIRGALRAVQRKLDAGHTEKVTHSAELDRSYGLLATERACYITRLLSSGDYVDFGRLFPDLAHQIGWTRGIMLSRQDLASAISATRKMPQTVSMSTIMIFVDECGRFSQIGPATLMGFCEYMGLVAGRGNSQYAFPTIILSPVFGTRRGEEEHAVLRRVSLISQVNNSGDGDEDARKERFVDAVLQLGNPDAGSVSEMEDTNGVPTGSFDQFDFAGDGTVLAVLNEINRNLTRIRELLENAHSK